MQYFFSSISSCFRFFRICRLGRVLASTPAGTGLVDCFVRVLVGLAGCELQAQIEQRLLKSQEFIIQQVRDWPFGVLRKLADRAVELAEFVQECKE